MYTSASRPAQQPTDCRAAGLPNGRNDRQDDPRRPARSGGRVPPVVAHQPGGVYDGGAFRDPEPCFALSNDAIPREYNAQSLERGLFVLAYLRDSAQGRLSLAEISAGLELNKSTVHRLLATLVRHGYVAQDPATKRYRLGLGFLSFGHRVVEQLDVRRHALRIMRALAEESGEAVHLNVLAGTGALCVEEVVGPNGATLGSNVGVVLPLHSVPTGKCFLAWMGEAERTALLYRLDFR